MDGLPEFKGGVALIGGSPSPAGTGLALEMTAHTVCADGGARHMAGRRQPDVIIGDLDSLPQKDEWRSRPGTRLIHVEEQETTDFEKCLRHVRADFFICGACLGGRLDHELAAMHALIAEERPVILAGEEDIIFSPGRRIHLSLEEGDRISLFPLRKCLVEAASGLKWPAEGLTLEAGARIGASNEATGEVTLGFDRAGVLVILPRARIHAALSGLMNRWTDR